MYEPEELAALESEIERVLATGQPFTFVDIGANVGLSGNFERLTFNIASNPPLPIEPVAVALGDHVGEVAITLNRRDRGGTRIQINGGGGTDAVNVPLKPLLSLLQERDIGTVDALKIDVEGMEDTVLAPFFHNAPAALWPRMILIEDSRTERGAAAGRTLTSYLTILTASASVIPSVVIAHV